MHYEVDGIQREESWSIVVIINYVLRGLKEDIFHFAGVSSRHKIKMMLRNDDSLLASLYPVFRTVNI